MFTRNFSKIDIGAFNAIADEINRLEPQVQWREFRLHHAASLS